MDRLNIFRFFPCVVAILILGSPLLVTAATPAITLDEIPEYAPDRIMVAFQPGTPGATARSVHAQNGGQLLKTFDFINVDLVSVPAGSVAAKVALYSKNPNVLFAEPSYYKVMVIPNEGGEPVPPGGIGSYWEQQWGLHNNTGTFNNYLITVNLDGTFTYTAIPVATDIDADIDAPEAWDIFEEACIIQNECAPSRIAILDTGVDCSHIDLNCDVDVNVVTEHVVGGVDDGDLLRHGTHVAGIAAAENHNGVGIAGVSWNSTIGSYKVCFAASVNGQIVGLCDSAAIVDALGQITAAQGTPAKFDVVNMSFGGSDIPLAEVAALNAAAAAGIVLVSSAGNNYALDGCTFPSTHPSVISVGSTDFHDNLSPFSNFGDCVSVLAPGSNIFSTFPDAACGFGPAHPEGCYSWLEGTSMASPAVAGLAGMIRTMVPLATAEQVRGLIEGNAELFGARAQNLRAWSEFGRINAADTMNAATTTTPPPAAEYMYIEDINMYARGPHLNIDVTIRWDSDGSGTVTPGDAPAVGAILYVALCGNINLNDPCNFKSTAVATDASGQASYKARGATGIYYFGITDIQHDQYDWNAGLNQVTNPASYSF